MHYTQSPRKRLGNWLAGSKYKWVRSLSDLCYTAQERREIAEDAKGIVDAIVQSKNTMNAVLAEHPELKEVLREDNIGQMTKYSLFTIDTVLFFRGYVGIEKLTPFLKAMAPTREAYDVIVLFFARAPMRLHELGYLDYMTGQWRPDVDDAALESATQLMRKELATQLAAGPLKERGYDVIVKELEPFI